MKIIRTIILITAAIYIVALSVVNSQKVDFFLPFSDSVVSIQLYLLLFVAITIGVLIGGIPGISKRFVFFRKDRESKRKIKTMEKEIESLKQKTEIKNQMITDERN